MCISIYRVKFLSRKAGFIEGLLYISAPGKRPWPRGSGILTCFRTAPLEVEHLY